MKVIIAIITIISTWNQINAQTPKYSLTRNEAYFYSNRATGWLKDNDPGVLKKAELVMMFLECDTLGRVVKINLLAEDQSDSSLYGLLRKMKPEDFNSKQVNYGAREKIIILNVPSLMYPGNTNSYVDRINEHDGPFATEDHSAIIKEGYDFIQVNGLSYVFGITKKERLPCISSEQESKKKRKKTDKELIYEEVVSAFYDYQPASIVIDDSSFNASLSKLDFTPVIKGRTLIYPLLDSTWEATLKEGQILAAKLPHIKLPAFKPPCVFIRFIPTDSIQKSYKNMGHYGFEETFKVGDRVTLSNVIQVKNRAIVELDRNCGSLCGSGNLLFLEKRNGKWVIVSTMMIWIS